MVLWLVKCDPAEPRKQLFGFMVTLPFPVRLTEPLTARHPPLGSSAMVPVLLITPRRFSTFPLLTVNRPVLLGMLFEPSRVPPTLRKVPAPLVESVPPAMLPPFKSTVPPAAVIWPRLFTTLPWTCKVAPVSACMVPELVIPLVAPCTESVPPLAEMVFWFTMLIVPCPSDPCPLMVLSTFIKVAPEPLIAAFALLRVMVPAPDSVCVPLPEIPICGLWFSVIFPRLTMLEPKRLRDAVGTLELPMPRLSLTSRVKPLQLPVVLTVRLETRLLPLSIRQSSLESGRLPRDHLPPLVHTPGPPSQMSCECTGRLAITSRKRRMARREKETAGRMGASSLDGSSVQSRERNITAGRFLTGGFGFARELVSEP